MTTFTRLLRKHVSTTSTPVVGLLLLLPLLLLLSACGGGGQGLRMAAPDPLAIGTALPQLESGDVVDFEIPIGGGCGGPYVIEVIGGLLPDGIGIDTDNGRHHLVGVLLEDGSFPFTLKVTDTNCVPFSTNTAAFSWDVGQGPVRIVMAEPAIIPNAQFGDPNKYMDSWGPDGQAGTADDNTPGFTVDALETVVYGSSTVINLIAAGGVPPYVCSIVDDPNDPKDDLGLPTPTAFAVNSCSIIGAPIQVLSGGLPFRFTVRVTDGAGKFSDRKFQWKVDTPPIIQANTGLADGTAGTGYADVITVVDGVPPIQHEFLDDVPEDDGTVDPMYLGGIQYVPGSVPVVPKTREGLGIQFAPTGSADVGVVADSARLEPVAGRTQYPPETAQLAMYSPYPSEGMFIVDESQDAGVVQGIPRRWGDFEVFVHSYSALVPNERGQHAVIALEFSIAQADPPTVMDPGFTVEKVWIPAPTYSTLPEFEKGQPYDPENDNVSGLTLLAAGGVPADGMQDNPHASELQQDPLEVPGSFTWRSDWETGNQTAWDGPPPGITFDAAGVIDVGNANLLQRAGRELVDIEVRDYQLPLGTRNVDMQRVAYSVGPDVSIISYSSTSESGTDFYWASSYRFGLNDVYQTIEKFEVFETSSSRSKLDATDLAKTTTVPSIAFSSTPSNPLGALISGATGGDSNIDLLNGTVNATGWWDDSFQMNPKAARAGSHSDLNRTDYYYGRWGTSYSNQGNWQQSVPSVDLPDVGLGVNDAGHDPANGIYHNGGQMYFFDSSNRFGMFIVRPDAKIYVPFATQKNSSVHGFGDGMLFTKSSAQHCGLRTVQMTVSPDGRIAAFKLKTDMRNPFEHANNSQILFVSLTGEKIFGGQTYRIVSTNFQSVAGYYGSALVLQSTSMALTNDRLYFVLMTQCPSTQSTSSTSYCYRQSWQGLFFLRCGITSGTPQLIPVNGSDSNWTQGPGSPMQGVTHHHGPNASSSSSYWGLIETYTGYGRWPYHRYWAEDGMNLKEHTNAPAPFRVSANGKAVAFFAAANTTSTYATTVYSTYVWVDYDGTGAKRVTSSRRHHLNGSASSHRIVWGPYEYANWGIFTGPTPGLEISDDGLAVAATYNAYTGSVSSSYYYSSSSWRYGRENVEVSRSTSGTWNSYSVSEVTASTFGGSHYWRFGGLCFTAPEPGSGESTGLAFWGGAPMYQSASTSSSYSRCNHYVGTYYIYKLGDTNTVTSMLATSNGGNPDGAGKVYTSSSKFSPSSTSGLNNRFGALFPWGGFMSKNRKFLYVHTVPPITSSNGTCCRLVGLNVSSANAGSINGHANGRGFSPANWPSRRGIMSYYYYPYYGTRYMTENGYFPDDAQGLGLQVMAKDTGWVFWASNYQYYGTYSGGSSSYGLFVYPAYYNYAYGYGGLGVYGFDPDVGGPIANFTKSGWSSSSSSPYAFLSHMEVSRGGEKLVFNWVAQSSYHLRNYERVRWVRNIDFNPNTGALDSGYSSGKDAGDFETSNGRVGESFAVPRGGNDIYYARGGTGNENTKYFTRQRWDPNAGSWTKKAITTSQGTGRINVLWSGR